MDGFFESLWHRSGGRYVWVASSTSCPSVAIVYLFVGWVVLRIEDSTRYGSMAAIAAAIAVVQTVVRLVACPRAAVRDVHALGRGEPIDPGAVLASSYRLGRNMKVWLVVSTLIATMLMAMSAAMLAGLAMVHTTGYAASGVLLGLSIAMIGAHGQTESLLRPVRAQVEPLARGGDLARTRPTVAQWSNIGLLGTMCSFAMAGVALGESYDIVGQPLLLGVLALAFTVLVGVPITLTQSIAPMLHPLADLSAATKRVTHGDFGQPVPVVQDDDLGVLAASFNRMQNGLAERERLQSAFGSYVDPALAERLLAQSDDLFSGERVQVTVMFVDIRDFTPFAEANTAEDTVSHLNDLFEIVVDVVTAAGGHVNKFLGDGAMVVFGAPERLDDHADRALACAADIDRQVTDRFRGEVKIGVGINTGTVIAGTIGSSKKREFTLIGDAVNVAARVEQLTKTTGDTILITQQVLAAATTTPDGLVDRGIHELKGKAEPVTVHALHQPASSTP